MKRVEKELEENAVEYEPAEDTTVFGTVRNGRKNCEKFLRLILENEFTASRFLKPAARNQSPFHT